jgi:hypothetical protein
MASLKSLTVNDTGFLRLPSGTIAQRPASPSVGQTRFNTNLNITEYYNGSLWSEIVTQGPPVVQDQLRISFDAAYPLSYVQGSPRIHNLNGEIIGTLQNGVGYSSSNGGTLVFDGTNDSVSFTPYGVSVPNGMSFDIWWRSSDGTKYQDIFDFLDIYGVWITLNGFGTTGKITASFNTVANIIQASYSINTWYNLVLVGSGTTNILYLNGVNVGTESRSVPTYVSFNGARLGNLDQDRSSEYFVGNIASFRFYTKALSATEVLNNFNSTKSRFGL